MRMDNPYPHVETSNSVRHFLRFTPEAQIHEILDYFTHTGLTATKQGIDAAVRTHPNVFGVRRRGREKFLYLK